MMKLVLAFGSGLFLGIASPSGAAEPPANPGPVFTFTDTDGDGYSDTAETAFGSKPDDASDRPDHSPNPAKPNVVIIYADDMGFGDVSAYGDLYGTASPTVTPHMNSLAAEGVMFTQAHSSNGVCTPSRYALLTGKYNWREFNGITNHYGGQKNGKELPRQSDVTIAEYLKGHAYDTAAFGKWHLGGAFYTRSGSRVSGNPNTPTEIDWARPVEHHAVANGFDTFRGLASSINFGPYVYLHDDRVQYWDSSLNGGSGGYRNATNSDNFHWFTTAELNSTVVGAKDSRASLGDPSYTQVGAEPQMIGQVEEYLNARKQSGDTDPFMMYVSLYSPHKPWAITAPYVGSEGFNYGDFIKEVDARIGRVIAAIDTNGFRDNTLIILTSDNGPENTAVTETIANNRDTNGPLRGNKRDVWDGGTRVPFVVRWPGQAAPGLVSNEVIWQGDIFATVAAFLGDQLPVTTAPDGESFLNIIRGQQKPEPRRPSIIVSSGRGDLGLKTVNGWKFIDSSGGGNVASWDSKNKKIANAAGVNKGFPKQLFHQAIDLGEDNNLIAGLTTEASIRSALINAAGVDLLNEMDQYRLHTTAARFPRMADNDADGMPNEFEIAHGLDPHSPADYDGDLDGDGLSNGDEWLAGTSPVDASERFQIISLEDFPDSAIVSWQSIQGRKYEVFWSIDLQTWNRNSVHTGTGAILPATLDKAVISGDGGETEDVDSIYVRIGVSM